MRVGMFYHSLLSDWNHGNAHFLRGVATELILRGHEVKVFEPEDSWSFQNLVNSYGDGFIAGFRRVYPHLKSTRYDLNRDDIEQLLENLDVVLVHEWNSRSLIREIARYRKTHRCRALFHDTHHRSISDSANVLHCELENFDGILAFGASVADRYRALGWGTRVWTWHEAADVQVFHPISNPDLRRDLVWIGNWGDGERNAELHEFLLDPVKKLRLEAEAYGVRYPEEALSQLRESGIDFKSWVPNYLVPELFSRFRVTVHVPRRFYAQTLPGVPTIRVFEALACGIPLVSAPWIDSEQLFTVGEDFLMAGSGEEMKRQLSRVLSDGEMASEIAAHGLRTIRSRHTCGHRVDELIHICDELGVLASNGAALSTRPHDIAETVEGSANWQPA